VKVNIELHDKSLGKIEMDQDVLLGDCGPRKIQTAGLSDSAIAERILNPIGPRLSELARDKKRVLIVTDDNTRQTPVQRLLPPVLDELSLAGVEKEDITILIGLGTHRPMTLMEIEMKFGKDIPSQYRIMNHAWDDPDSLVSLGQCDLGYEVVLNKLAVDSDCIIVVGNIVPHATTGFSAGGKTIMPGISGEKTIEDTHWSALNYSMAEILGNPDNEVRMAILSVCKKIPMAFIVNTVLFEGDNVYGVVAGQLDAAHKEGIKLCREVHGVDVPNVADIVVAEAYPTDIDLRQAIKAICAADLVCRDGGIIILPSLCPEGIAPQFPNFEKYGFSHPDKVYHDVEEGILSEKLLAYTLVAIGRIISERVKCILVSPNIGEQEAKHMGMYWSKDLQSAYDLACEMLGQVQAKTIVLREAGELLPRVTA